jgi:acetyltransferase
MDFLELDPATDGAEDESDIWHQAGRNPLDPFFRPRSVAVVGASQRPGSVGRAVLWNLVTSPFGGAVHPINHRHGTVLGIRTAPRVGAVGEPIDLAVLATPAATVPGLLRECVQAGVRGAVVLSSGFREAGEVGAKLEEEALAVARSGGMRLLGPNCLGIMVPTTGLNATFAKSLARKGSVALISQSGALQAAILDWSLQQKIGFSAFVSVGSMCDVGWGDLLDYLGNDAATRSILLYMESIGDARAFLSAAREVALRKPIIVLRGGRSQAAARAAATHTGSVAGDDEVLSAAFRRSGVLRVDSIAELFYMADALAKQPRPQGRRLAIVTNAGGPGLLAADALLASAGELAALSPASLPRLAQAMPPRWRPGAPIDLLDDADPERFAQAVEIAAEDEGTDGLLVVLTPQAATDPTATAERLRPLAHRFHFKPVLASWMGGEEVAAGRRILAEAGIPAFRYPDTAAKIFLNMWRYTSNVNALYETPAADGKAAQDHGPADRIVRAARAAGRTLLSELESKEVLAAYGLPAAETRYCGSADEAVSEAERIGYPVVLKLHSTRVAHKSDAGGVHLDLRTGAAVREAFAATRAGLEAVAGAGPFEGATVQPFVRAEGTELLLGSAVDPQFGPVILFGAGGLLTEMLADRAFGLPPLNTTLARRMMEQTRVSRLLAGVRGRAQVDRTELERLLVRFSQLVLEQRAVKEIDVNPLLASSSGLVALDARIVLHGPEVPDDALPLPAITPYPTRYFSSFAMKDGRRVSVRPIRPEDEPRVVRFHGTLSAESVYLRYASTLKLDQRVAHERLARICFIDYAREMALVGELPPPEGVAGPPEIIAIGRLSRLPGTRDAEFALLISDAYQGQGLGREMLQRLFDVGRDWGCAKIVAEILADNGAMRRVCKGLGFTFERPPGTYASKLLEPAASGP